MTIKLFRPGAGCSVSELIIGAFVASRASASFCFCVTLRTEGLSGVDEGPPFVLLACCDDGLPPGLFGGVRLQSVPWHTIGDSQLMLEG